MTNSNSQDLIRRWSDLFGEHPLAAQAITDLRERRDEIWEGTFNLMRQENTEYRNSVDDDFTQESKAHCGELLRTVIGIATRKVVAPAPDPFEFVRTHAVWRASHQVPLAASLHAYRLAHRTYLAITRNALLRQSAEHASAIPALTALSDFWMEFFEHLGAVLTETHVVEEDMHLALSTGVYSELYRELLAGVGPLSPETQKVCEYMGIRAGASMAVVVAKPLGTVAEDPRELEVRLRSIARLIKEALPTTTYGKLIDIRNHGVIAIVCAPLDASRNLLAALNRPGNQGKKVQITGVGVSRGVSEFAQLPDAVDEAEMALSFATPAHPYQHFSDIELPEFLIRYADRAAFRLIPDWVHQLGGHDGSTDLSLTIRKFAECNFNVKQTARRLNVHTNTVYFRLNRIHSLTGIDPREFSGASQLLTALRMLELQKRSNGET